jgi:peptidoglycan hydrolase-like protein with peptidoglycan-binding domain
MCRRQLLGGPPDVDGDFGPHTEQAVRDYQSGEHIAVDGIVGPVTWSHMLGEYPEPPILENGSQWPHVNRLQDFLNHAQPPANPQLVVDDIFGAKTENAVKGYQSAHQVPADGVVGYKTWVIHIGALGAMVADEVGV